MDSDYIDEDNEAIAAAMGFAGFGKKDNPAKKRKFNPLSDAYVEGDVLAKLDKGGKKGHGSGGNTMPLGKARVFGTATAKPVEQEVVVKQSSTNEDEISLEDDEDVQPNYIDTSRTPPTENEEPQYIDTSRTPPIENQKGSYADTDQPPAISDTEAADVQARIDALLARIQPDETTRDSALQQPDSIASQLPQRPAVSDTAFMQGLPKPSPHIYSGSVAGISRPSHRGQRNEFWYIDYYDPSFNENPWERLEKAKGLEPLGTWPENTGRQKSG